MISAAALLLAAEGLAAGLPQGLQSALTRYAAVHDSVTAVTARIAVTMSHSGTGGAESPPVERFVFVLKAVRDDAPRPAEAEESWSVEAEGVKPRIEPVRYASRNVWTRSANGQWARNPAFRDARALKMLAVARGWAFQYLEDVPERWLDRAQVRALSGSHRYEGKRAWRVEVTPKWRFVQTAMASRWEIVLSPEGLPWHSRSYDKDGREVTVITSRDWRVIRGLPVAHSFTIVVRPPQEARPDRPDPVTTLECRLSDVTVARK